MAEYNEDDLVCELEEMKASEAEKEAQRQA
jgi:hypothetical protein